MTQAQMVQAYVDGGFAEREARGNAARAVAGLRRPVVAAIRPVVAAEGESEESIAAQRAAQAECREKIATFDAILRSLRACPQCAGEQGHAEPDGFGGQTFVLCRVCGGFGVQA